MENMENMENMEKNKLSREEIKRLAKESAGALSWIALLEPLVIDTNILADHAWARDNNITYLIEGIAGPSGVYDCRSTYM